MTDADLFFSACGAPLEYPNWSGDPAKSLIVDFACDPPRALCRVCCRAEEGRDRGDPEADCDPVESAERRAGTEGRGGDESQG